MVIVAAALAWFGAGCSSPAKVLRDDSRELLVGADCDTGAFCHGRVPAGIVHLVADLKALDQQQLADPSCASQNQP